MQPTVALGMSLLPFQTTWGMELYSPRKSIFELVIIQKISGGSWLIGRSYFPANQKWPLEFIDLIELSSSFQNCLNIDEGSFIFIRFFVRSRQNCWSTCNTIPEWDEFIVINITWIIELIELIVTRQVFKIIWTLMRILLYLSDFSLDLDKIADRRETPSSNETNISNIGSFENLSHWNPI